MYAHLFNSRLAWTINKAFIAGKSDISEADNGGDWNNTDGSESRGQ